MILVGDCVEVMAELDAASVDAVVCDPPYGLEFMGKDWDKLKATGTWAVQDHRGTPYHRSGPRETWSSTVAMQDWHERWAREALRVLKPGGHLLAFGGTRTYHRMTCAIEDAGFEIRDCVAWMYGSGFPKSLDVSKAIDKAAGADREVVAEGAPTKRMSPGSTQNKEGWNSRGDGREFVPTVTAPATEDAARWDGWGTALKPAFEPVVVARKPLVGTVAGNVLAHGTGALNIDGCRIATSDRWEATGVVSPASTALVGGVDGSLNVSVSHDAGRWPANVLLTHTPDCVQVGTRQVASNGHFPAARPSGSDLAGASGHAGQTDLVERSTAGETVEAWDCAPDCPVGLLDAQTGVLQSPAPYTRSDGQERRDGRVYQDGAGFARLPEVPSYGDSGGASRFFYVAKASRAERNAGLAGFEEQAAGGMAGRHDGSFDGHITMSRNVHPTVKPIGVMRWLVRLVTPPGGRVLDPFLGSGTTGIAALLEGFDWVGVEQDPDYARIAEARVAFWREHGEDGLRIVAERDALERRFDRERAAHVEAGQLDLFGEPV